jgi:hypothetical protein
MHFESREESKLKDAAFGQVQRFMSFTEQVSKTEMQCTARRRAVRRRASKTFHTTPRLCPTMITRKFSHQNFGTGALRLKKYKLPR